MNAAYGKGNDVMESYAQGQIWTHASIWVHTLLANPNLLKPSKYDGRIKDYSVWAQCMRSNPHIWVKGKMSLRWKCINRRSLITKASQQAGSGYRGLATKAPIQRATRKSQGVNETKKKDFHLIRMRWKAGGFCMFHLTLSKDWDSSLLAPPFPSCPPPPPPPPPVLPPPVYCWGVIWLCFSPAPAPPEAVDPGLPPPYLASAKKDFVSPKNDLVSPR